MEKIGLILIALITIIVTGIGPGVAQPLTPRESIPADISPEVRKQIDRLRSQDAIERAYAADSLKKMGEKAAPAIPFLIAILDDFRTLQWNAPSGAITSPSIEATEALAGMGTLSLEPLLGVLRNVHWPWPIRMKAAKTLGYIKNNRAVDPLIAALRDKISEIRENAAWALGYIKDTRAVEPLIGILKDRYENERVLRETILALGKLRDERAVEALFDALSYSNYTISTHAAEVLEEIKGANRVELLIVRLRNGDQKVRQKAAKAVQTLEIKDERVADLL